MIAQGESEVAEDELVWLLGGCHEFLAGHLKLGELALERDDVSLARGHFGAAYQLALTAYRRSGAGAASVPYQLPANQAAHQAGKGARLVSLPTGKRRDGRGGGGYAAGMGRRRPAERERPATSGRLTQAAPTFTRATAWD